jgi:hypothetical protein
MYSTADIAKRLGCTVQAVNKYRRKIEKRDGKQLGKPDPADARRTLFSEDEVSQIAELAPKIPVTAPTDADVVDAELIDGDDTETVISPQSTSLALRHSQLPAVQRRRFDLATAQENLTAIDAHTNATASRADSLLSELATTELLAAAADIKQTVATMKANALGDAVGALGKPTDAPTDGTTA